MVSPAAGSVPSPSRARWARLGPAATFVRQNWPTLLFLLLALAIFSWVSWEAVYVRAVTYEGGADYWEHSATLHALTENPWHPRHPHLETGTQSPRFGPQFLLLALISRALHLDAIAAMSLGAVLNTLLFLVGIRCFFLTFFRHQLAPLYALLVMFGGWWQGFHYSNVYSLSVFFNVAAFPSTTALGLTFLGFTLTIRLLRSQPRWPGLAFLLLGVWAAAVFIIHPLTAVMSLSGSGLLALSAPGVTWRRRLEVLVAVALGSALSHFWPYFSPWLVLRGGHGESAGWAGQSLHEATAELHVKRRLHEFYGRDALLRALGLSLLALLALPYFFWRRERWFVALGALSMLLPFVGNAFVELPLGHRFVLLAIFYLHIGVVWLLLSALPSFPGAFAFVRVRWARVALNLTLVSLLLVFSVHSVLLAREQLSNRKFYSRRESPVISNARAFAAAAGPHAIVLANALLSWPLPTFGPKVVVLFHNDPLVPDQTRREYLVKRFLGARASNDERRAILAQYGVSHVLLGRESGPVLGFLAQTATVQTVGTGYHLYTLNPDAANTSAPE